MRTPNIRPSSWLAVAISRRAMTERKVQLPSIRQGGSAGETCLGAHSGADGAIVVAGTGSVGVGLIGGREIRIAGYGFPVSDEGSGADMATPGGSAFDWNGSYHRMSLRRTQAWPPVQPERALISASKQGGDVGNVARLPAKPVHGRLRD